MNDLERLRAEIAQFAEDRDWGKFHSPKNLSMALSVEVSELLELFQWLTEDESRTPSAELKQALSQELADSAIYLIRLADQLDINLVNAIDEKLSINKEKYPAEKVRGSAAKYTAYNKGNNK